MSPRRESVKSEGAPWPSGAAPALSEIERATLVVVLTLRGELRREPSRDEIEARLGVRDVRGAVDSLERSGLLTLRLTRRQHDCLAAIVTLEGRLGRSPSTREVSDAMGLSPTGSRFHIAGLARMGLVTRPEVVLVLRATPLGRAFLVA